MAAPRHILGISAFYHDSAAALLRDGQIVAAAQEERFSRKKNDERFPIHAVAFCLERAQITVSDLEAVVFYDKPITKFARLLESYLAIAPRGWRTFPRVLPGWLGEKLDLRSTIRNELSGLPAECPIWFTEHHRAHAASAFFPSPFSEAAIVTVDGVGEWATTTIGRGEDQEVALLKELRFPHSLGLLYSAFTSYCGFRINSGEYKLMGLAPYGTPRFAEAIRSELIDLREDGSFWLNLEYFDFLGGTRMTNDRFHRLFQGAPRRPEGPVDQRHMDVARSIQTVTEEVMLRLARHARELTGSRHLCLAGGVALNCVANGRILRERLFEKIWIQPAAGDAGGALGAAYLGHYRQSPSTAAALATTLPTPHRVSDPSDSMQGAFLGPEFDAAHIEAVLLKHGARYERLSTEKLLSRVSELLAEEKVVGWFQGRMEFGPRALGNRSILGDARSPRMQTLLNLKVKFRESFRPFAPAVRRERLGEYFELDESSPYMLLVAMVKETLRRPVDQALRGLELLKAERSTVPAVTHVDYSARVQTVSAEQNPLFYQLILRFEARTGCAVLINTSFNVRGQPVVCTPEDAYRCFVSTEMDYLAIGPFLLDRTLQPTSVALRPGELQPD